MSEITKGKWEIEEYDAILIRPDAGNSILICGDNSEANAQAISAVLELIEACEEAIVDMEYCRCNHKQDSLDEKKITETILKIEAALAKAGKGI